MRFRRAVTFLILFLGFQCVRTSGQQVVATWTDTTGNWSNAANWSTNQLYVSAHLTEGKASRAEGMYAQT